jgi:hypothetical protein
MMKRVVLSAAVVSAICLITVVSGHAQRGGGGGGRGGMGGGQRPGGMQPEMMAQVQALRAFPLEQQWTALSFACELSDSQLIMLRPIIADAYAKRLGVLEAARKNKSWDDAKDVMDDLKDDVDEKLEVVLTKDQRKKLKKAIKNSSKYQPRMGR